MRCLIDGWNREENMKWVDEGMTDSKLCLLKYPAIDLLVPLPNKPCPFLTQS